VPRVATLNPKHKTLNPKPSTWLSDTEVYEPEIRARHIYQTSPQQIVEDGAMVSITQCEVRNFGGKCIVARFFSQVLLGPADPSFRAH